MNETQKRMLLYGGAMVVLAGIGVAWIKRDKDADLMTLLSSARMQLQMAYAIPAVDKQGNELSARGQMIESAERYLADVERMQPDMAVTAELRGFAHMLRGEHEQAASCYAHTRQCADFDETQHDVLAFNEARMRIAAGQPQLALQVFAQNQKQIDVHYRLERLLAEASTLRELGRPADAELRLATVMQEAADAPVARLQCGQQWLGEGQFERAEQAFEGVRQDVPIADYYLARLKLRRGEVDSAIGLLVRASEARPAEVRSLLREDAAAWSTVAEDARFQELTRPLPATPGR